VEFAVVLSGAVVSTYLQWSGERTIASLTDYETRVRVRRDAGESVVSSSDLVPGDVVLVTDTDWVIPCDMVLLSGACIMDESGLTGESMPVQKKECAPDAAVEYQPAAAYVAQHTLFAGTTVLQISQEDSAPDTNSGTGSGSGKDGSGPAAVPTVEAYVTATGSATSKGALVSAILFPEELRFKYEEELEVVICLLLCYGIFAFILVVYFISQNGSQSTAITKWVYGVFTASQIFSPLLPVALKVGQIRSSQRLQEKSIFCVSPRHIAICGKINVFCFDKTGTLTKEGMDFSGAVPVEGGGGSGGPYLADLLSTLPGPGPGPGRGQGLEAPASGGNGSGVTITLSPLFQHAGPNADTDTDLIPDTIVECMATCHNVALYGGNKFVGKA
jgi:magnesium-transporting ATPase (P-type)